MRRALLPVLLLLPLAGCSHSPGCVPTVMTAQDASKVSVTSPLGSAVLRARLTARGKPLPGATVTFLLRANGSTVSSVSDSTAADGRSAVDLKGKVSPSDLVGLARATSFTAAFAGNSGYCSSADDGAFRVL